jgi:small subunit ribosomal protein S18
MELRGMKKTGGRSGRAGGRKFAGEKGRGGKRRGLVFRKRSCRFCTHKINSVDYKDLKTVESFISEKGKILSTRSTGNCAKHQRMITEAIKKARFIALLPYVRH